MNQTLWNQYQTALTKISDPGMRPSPNLWMYQMGYSPDLPYQNQYSPVYGSFQPNTAQTQEVARQAAINNIPTYHNIDPQRTSGYTFKSQLDSGQKKGMLDYMSKYNPTMTEYQYRLKFGLDTTTVKGSYTPVNYGSFGHSTNTITPGNTGKVQSGTAKLAAQGKVVTNSSGTKPATPSPGTTAKQSVAANQIKTSPTTTAAKSSAAGKAAAKVQGQVSSTAKPAVSSKPATQSKPVVGKQNKSATDNPAVKAQMEANSKKTTAQIIADAKVVKTGSNSNDWIINGKDISKTDLTNEKDVADTNRLISGLNAAMQLGSFGLNGVFDTQNKANTNLNQWSKELSHLDNSQVSDLIYNQLPKILPRQATEVLWDIAHDTDTILRKIDESDAGKILVSPLGYVVNKSGVLETPTGKAVKNSSVAKAITGNPVIKGANDFNNWVFGDRPVTNSLNKIGSLLLLKGSGTQLESVLLSTDIAADAAMIKASTMGPILGTLTKGAAFVAKSTIRPAVTGYFVGSLAKDAKNVFSQGDIAKDAEFIGNTLLQGAVFGAGTLDAPKGFRVVPKIADKIGYKIPETIKTALDPIISDAGKLSKTSLDKISPQKVQMINEMNKVDQRNTEYLQNQKIPPRSKIVYEGKGENLVAKEVPNPAYDKYIEKQNMISNMKRVDELNKRKLGPGTLSKIGTSITEADYALMNTKTGKVVGEAVAGAAEKIGGKINYIGSSIEKDVDLIKNPKKSVNEYVKKAKPITSRNNDLYGREALIKEASKPVKINIRNPPTTDETVKLLQKDVRRLQTEYMKTGDPETLSRLKTAQKTVDAYVLKNKNAATVKSLKNTSIYDLRLARDRADWDKQLGFASEYNELTSVPNTMDSVYQSLKQIEDDAKKLSEAPVEKYFKTEYMQEGKSAKKAAVYHKALEKEQNANAAQFAEEYAEGMRLPNNADEFTAELKRVKSIKNEKELKKFAKNYMNESKSALANAKNIEFDAELVKLKSNNIATEEPAKVEKDYTEAHIRAEEGKLFESLQKRNSVQKKAEFKKLHDERNTSLKAEADKLAKFKKLISTNASKTEIETPGGDITNVAEARRVPKNRGIKGLKPEGLNFLDEAELKKAIASDVKEINKFIAKQKSLSASETKAYEAAEKAKKAEFDQAIKNLKSGLTIDGKKALTTLMKEWDAAQMPVDMSEQHFKSDVIDDLGRFQLSDSDIKDIKKAAAEYFKNWKAEKDLAKKAKQSQGKERYESARQGILEREPGRREANEIHQVKTGHVKEELKARHEKARQTAKEDRIGRKEAIEIDRVKRGKSLEELKAQHEKARQTLVDRKAGKRELNEIEAVKRGKAPEDVKALREKAREEYKKMKKEHKDKLSKPAVSELKFSGNEPLNAILEDAIKISENVNKDAEKFDKFKESMRKFNERNKKTKKETTEGSGASEQGAQNQQLMLKIKEETKDIKEDAAKLKRGEEKEKIKSEIGKRKTKPKEEATTSPGMIGGRRYYVNQNPSSNSYEEYVGRVPPGSPFGPGRGSNNPNNNPVLDAITKDSNFIKNTKTIPPNTKTNTNTLPKSGNPVPVKPVIGNPVPVKPVTGHPVPVKTIPGIDIPVPITPVIPVPQTAVPVKISPINPMPFPEPVEPIQDIKTDFDLILKSPNPYIPQLKKKTQVFKPQKNDTGFRKSTREILNSDRLIHNNLPTLESYIG